jgi:Ca2+-binding EF-hand superfamily protein
VSTRSLLGRSALAAALLVTSLGAAAQLSRAKLLTARDRLALEAVFAKADGNGDGRLSRDEAASMPEIAGRFDRLDKDKDGSLSLDEFATAVAT